MKESGKNFDDARIKKLKKYFHKLRDRLSKTKIKDLVIEDLLIF